MKYDIITTLNFKKEAKPLLKKYKSLKNELINLEKELLENPKKGTPLGNETYKIRLSIESKGKGKSGGARVISHLEIDLKIDKETTNIFLVTIYDKSEMESISKKEIDKLIKEIKKII
ncbi:MAG: type II toxin-antitoxin system RelE/ParE family toxin [Cyanobacteriota bacterium]